MTTGTTHPQITGPDDDESTSSVLSSISKEEENILNNICINNRNSIETGNPEKSIHAEVSKDATTTKKKYNGDDDNTVWACGKNPFMSSEGGMSAHAYEELIRKSSNKTTNLKSTPLLSHRSIKNPTTPCNNLMQEEEEAQLPSSEKTTVHDDVVVDADFNISNIDSIHEHHNNKALVLHDTNTSETKMNTSVNHTKSITSLIPPIESESRKSIYSRKHEKTEVKKAEKIIDLTQEEIEVETELNDIIIDDIKGTTSLITPLESETQTLVKTTIDQKTEIKESDKIIESAEVQTEVETEPNAFIVDDIKDNTFPITSLDSQTLKLVDNNIKDHKTEIKESDKIIESAEVQTEVKTEANDIIIDDINSATSLITLLQSKTRKVVNSVQDRKAENKNTKTVIESVEVETESNDIIIDDIKAATSPITPLNSGTHRLVNNVQKTAAKDIEKLPESTEAETEPNDIIIDNIKSTTSPITSLGSQTHILVNNVQKTTVKDTEKLPDSTQVEIEVEPESNAIIINNIKGTTSPITPLDSQTHILVNNVQKTTVKDTESTVAEAEPNNIIINNIKGTTSLITSLDSQTHILVNNVQKTTAKDTEKLPKSTQVEIEAETEPNNIIIDNIKSASCPITPLHSQTHIFVKYVKKTAAKDIEKIPESTEAETEPNDIIIDNIKSATSPITPLDSQTHILVNNVQKTTVKDTEEIPESTEVETEVETEPNAIIIDDIKCASCPITSLDSQTHILVNNVQKTTVKDTEEIPESTEVETEVETEPNAIIIDDIKCASCPITSLDSQTHILVNNVQKTTVKDTEEIPESTEAETDPNNIIDDIKIATSLTSPIESETHILVNNVQKTTVKDTEEIPESKEAETEVETDLNTIIDDIKGATSSTSPLDSQAHILVSNVQKTRVKDTEEIPESLKVETDLNIIIDDIKATTFSINALESEIHELANVNYLKIDLTEVETEPNSTTIDDTESDSTPLKVESNNNQQYNVSQHAYECLKFAWGYGSSIRIAKPFLKVTEDVADKVIHYATGIHLNNNEYDIIKPKLAELDEQIVNPAIMRLLRALAPMHDKVNDKLRPFICMVSRKLYFITYFDSRVD